MAIIRPSYWVCGAGSYINCDQWDDVNGCWQDMVNALVCTRYQRADRAHDEEMEDEEMRRKSTLEQELTTEEVQWLKSHPNHEETQKILIEARVADWDGIKERKIELFKKTCLRFHKWWTEKQEWQ